MKEKDKELLLQDLCGRLPYKVYINDRGTPHKLVNICWDGIKFVVNCSPFGTGHGRIGTPLFDGDICYIKPYLRPMSSMTEEELKEYSSLWNLQDEYPTDLDIQYKIDLFDWLNKEMFDFRGLIPKGLAEIAPEGMYELKLLDYYLPLPSQNESDSVIDNTIKITVGCKIRLKTNPDVILSIISNDCHGDEFECSNGSVLSLKQIEKYYELIK